MPQFDSSFERKLFDERRTKLEAIAALSLRLDLSLTTAAEAIYPNRFPAASEPLQLTAIPDILDRYDTASTEALEAEHPTVAVAGRLMSLRLQGKAGFAHLQQNGRRLQLYIRRDDVGDDAFALYKLLDLGDHLGVRGTLMRTRTGELTLKALPLHGRPALSFLAKAMLALPDKYHGLEDVELRYRQRYVDLIMNSGTLAKADAATTTENPPTETASSRPERSTPIEASSRPERSEVERPPHFVGEPPPPAQPQTLPPGTSAVTDAALPNNEHLDAPLNVREVFVKRAAILKAIRKFFDDRNYLEVETPMMHPVAGGAAARPFTTHHNALDLDLNLRIAPELYLKRLVVGGLDRVYEINRNFRNEGISTQHNPEFTMLEFYQAYSNYHDLMDLTQELIQFVATEVNGATTTHFNGETIELATQNWTKLTMREAIVKWWPETAGSAPSTNDFAELSRFGAALDRAANAYRKLIGGMISDENKSIWSKMSAFSVAADQARTTLTFEFDSLEERRSRCHDVLGRLIATSFELLAEPHLIQPTIIYDFPLAVSPLSKIKPNEPDWVERFEFYIGGFEVGNAFSELNDPLDQEARFQSQVADKDPESMAEVDHDYVRALGYGLPPTAGEGIGIDRLTMLLTGSRSIRDVILFPLLRPRSEPTSS